MQVPKPDKCFHKDGIDVFRDLSACFDSGLTPEMGTAIATLRKGGYVFWIMPGVVDTEYWQRFNCRENLQEIEDWLLKQERSAEALAVIFWFTVAVRSEWLRLPKHTASKHGEIYGRIGKLCDDLSHALTETDDLYASGFGRGMMFAYMLDFLTDEEREPLAIAIRKEQSVRGWPLDGPEVFPRVTVETLLKRLKAAAEDRALRGPTHRQPRKHGAERGYFIRRMDQLLALHFGKKAPHAVIAALTSKALNDQTTPADVSATLRNRRVHQR
ncbi:MAG: hypothetical protein ACYCUI_12365 [Vulcanimicrobiaceae bacterium]|jgi:hypothetical protein|nr:hypothetical protein [Betaproteobacteria bacterium]